MDMPVPEIRLAAPLIEDLAWLAKRMRPDEIAQYLALTGQTEYDPDQCARALASISGVNFVLVDREGYPVCAGGFEEVRLKVWQTWMVGTTEGWAKHWRAITKHSRRLMDNLLASDRAHRVQTYALASRRAAHVWYERGLGQTFEGVHRGLFADGQDGVCYAKVKENA